MQTYVTSDPYYLVMEGFKKALIIGTFGGELRPYAPYIVSTLIDRQALFIASTKLMCAELIEFLIV